MKPFSSPLLFGLLALVLSLHAQVPNIAIAQTGSSVRISWPANGTNILLQTTDLGSGIWTTNATFTSTTGMNSVTVASPVGNLFFRLLILNPISVTANYYVDSVNGNDSSSGTNQSTPLKTIAALMAKPFTNGTVTAFANGSWWHEQYTCPLYSNLVFTTYGVGTKPLFDASDPVPTNQWVKFGTTNAYFFNTTNMNPDPQELTFVWENGVNLKLTNSIAAVAATLGTYFFTNSSGLNVFINPYIGGNPATNGDLFEVANRLYGFYVASGSGYQNGYGSLTGIATRRNLGNNGSLQVSRAWTVNGCDVSDGSKHSAISFVGGTFLNCNFTNAYYGDNVFGDGGTALLQFYDSSVTYPYSHPFYVSNCTFYLTAYNVNVGGIGQHGASGGDPFWDFAEVDNCNFINLGVGAGFGAMTNVIYRKCYWTNCFGGVSDNRNDVFDECVAVVGDHHAASFVTPGAAGSLMFSNHTYISFPKYTGDGWVFVVNPQAYAESVVVVDTTFNCPAPNYIFAFNNTASTFYSRRSTYIMGNSAYGYYYFSTAMAGYDSDNNTFSGGSFHWNGADYATPAAICAASGQECTAQIIAYTGRTNNFLGTFTGSGSGLTGIASNSIVSINPSQIYPAIVNAGATAVSANYYVDSVNGSDSNFGTNQLAPLKTIAALSAKPFTN